MRITIIHSEITRYYEKIENWYQMESNKVKLIQVFRNNSSCAARDALGQGDN